MPPRAPGVHTHEEWKGMAQPVGLVVEPVVLNRLGIFPESATTVLADWQQRLEQLLEDHSIGEQWLSVAPSFELFCQEVLAWQPGDLRKPEELPAPVAVHLDEYEEVLRPDWFVPESSQGDGPLKAQLLVQEIPVGTPFDALPKGLIGRRQWEATPQQRLERLLKESEHPIGLLWNGVALRLVYAPRGESSGHLTFPLEPMTTVDGRPMLAALQMLLGPDRLFEGGASNTRLRPLMEQSRKEQNEVSTRLAEQVLEALWILLRGFDAAGLQTEDPSHIYGGLITVLLRLVFLLYAEDEELMPTDSLYGQHYSVGGLALRLRQDRADYQNAMEGRRGAWATLLSLFRLVYDGGGSTEAYLPARHGDLFDPDAYPFLEGRTADTAYTEGPLASVPAISDDVVEQVLTKLLLLDGQILSYRALDVEQIGSVYEGIMGFMVEKATGPSVGITYRPPRQKITITVVVNAEELLAQPAAKRANFLDVLAGVKFKLSAPIVRALKEASSHVDLAAALGNRLSSHTPRVLPAGSLVLQPTAERRRSGSHYTPRALTEPVIAQAFRPWLERCHNHPTAQEILELKVCDPAMGSGAFLVAACRYLASWLVQAWERDGFPEDFRREYDKDIVARRLIAHHCLYGVDKNPFAVNLGKLSLWLVTLSKNSPFTFVDHAIKHGDSLIGASLKEVNQTLECVQLSLMAMFAPDQDQAALQRAKSFGGDVRTDVDYDNRQRLLRSQSQKLALPKVVADIIVEAQLLEKSQSKRNERIRQAIESLQSALPEKHTLQDNNCKPDLSNVYKVALGNCSSFHWEIEFPEVFRREASGFDILVGNPPFLGGTKLEGSIGSSARSFLVEKVAGGRTGLRGAADLSAYFFLNAAKIVAPMGSIAFISTNSICQGDSRIVGLRHLIASGMSIYYAVRSAKWPGEAATHYSEVCLASSKYMPSKCILDRNEVNYINSALRASSMDASQAEPHPLKKSSGLCFEGAKIAGKGFIISNEEACILLQDASYSDVVKPYLAGEDVNNHPEHMASRWVINFDDMPLRAENSGIARSAEDFPLALEIVKQRVLPQRISLNSNTSWNRGLKDRWWQFGLWRPALRVALDGKSRAIVGSRVTAHHCFAIVNASQVFSDRLVVIAQESYGMFALLSSRLHEVWAHRPGATTQGATLNYLPTRAFATFPLQDLQLVDDVLGELGRRYYSERSRYLTEHDIGLTKFYNRFHSPRWSGGQLEELRELHDLIDREALSCYGYKETCTAAKFTLGDAVLSEDAELAMERALEMLDMCPLAGFSADQVKELEAIYISLLEEGEPLPWRLKWSEEQAESVIDFLLGLNASQQVAEDLESRSSSLLSVQDSSVDSVRFAKAAESSSANQISLDLLFNDG